MRDRIKTTCTKLLNNAVVVTNPAHWLAANWARTNITCSVQITEQSQYQSVDKFGTYQYSINGGGTWQGTGSYINLSSGSYDVRIRDAASSTCYLVLEPMLVITDPPALYSRWIKTNVTCFGVSDGSITINGAAGGYGTSDIQLTGNDLAGLKQLHWSVAGFL